MYSFKLTVCSNRRAWCWSKWLQICMLYCDWLYKKLSYYFLGISKSFNWWKIGCRLTSHWIFISTYSRWLFDGRVTLIIYVWSNNDKETRIKKFNSWFIWNAFISGLIKSFCSKIHETCYKENSKYSYLDQLRRETY